LARSPFALRARPVIGRRRVDGATTSRIGVLGPRWTKQGVCLVSRAKTGLNGSADWAATGRKVRQGPQPKVRGPRGRALGRRRPPRRLGAPLHAGAWKVAHTETDLLLFADDLNGVVSPSAAASSKPSAHCKRLPSQGKPGKGPILPNRLTLSTFRPSAVRPLSGGGPFRGRRLRVLRRHRQNCLPPAAHR